MCSLVLHFVATSCTILSSPPPPCIQYHTALCQNRKTYVPRVSFVDYVRRAFRGPTTSKGMDAALRLMRNDVLNTFFEATRRAPIAEPVPCEPAERLRASKLPRVGTLLVASPSSLCSHYRSQSVLLITRRCPERGVYGLLLNAMMESKMWYGGPVSSSRTLLHALGNSWGPQPGVEVSPGTWACPGLQPSQLSVEESQQLEA